MLLINIFGAIEEGHVFRFWRKVALLGGWRLELPKSELNPRNFAFMSLNKSKTV